MSEKINNKLLELEIKLPKPADPVASYLPYVISGNLLFISGQGPFNENGLIVSDADKRQESPIVRSDNFGGAFVVWGDKRNGSIGIYAQHIQSDGSISLLDDGKAVSYTHLTLPTKRIV